MAAAHFVSFIGSGNLAWHLAPIGPQGRLALADRDRRHLADVAGLGDGDPELDAGGQHALQL